jgi:hypothetical protein
MFFLLTHPDGRQALVRAPSAQVAQAQAVKELKEPTWNEAKVQIPREDGATCVILAGFPIEPVIKPRKVKIKTEKAKPKIVDPEYGTD